MSYDDDDSYREPAKYHLTQASYQLNDWYESLGPNNEPIIPQAFWAHLMFSVAEDLHRIANPTNRDAALGSFNPEHIRQALESIAELKRSGDKNLGHDY